MERRAKVANKFNFKSRKKSVLEKDLGIFEENGAPKAFLKKIFNKALGPAVPRRGVLMDRRASSLHAAG